MELDFHRAGSSTRFGVHLATKWTLEILAGAIFSIKENSEPINAKYLQINYTELYFAIKNKPGGWAGLVEMAGFDPKIEKSDRHAWGRKESE